MEDDESPIDEVVKEKRGFFEDSDGSDRFSWVWKVVPVIAFVVIFPVTIVILFIGEIIVFGILRPLEPLTYGALLGMFTIPLVVGVIISLVIGVALGLFTSRKISDASEAV
ncbi:MAG: hypothetical protein ACXACA_00490 [Candidatus Ranarchaeia archaeon]|jgi:hypothetical protein